MWPLGTDVDGGRRRSIWQQPAPALALAAAVAASRPAFQRAREQLAATVTKAAAMLEYARSGESQQGDTVAFINTPDWSRLSTRATVSASR